MSDDHQPGSWDEHLESARRRAASPYGNDLDHRLVPDPSLPLGETVTFQSLSLTTLPLAGSVARELDGPLDWLGGQRQVQAPAEGVLVTNEQAWRLRGVTLGRLLHSLPLAPGEVTQIAVSNWTRRTRGQSDEEAAEQETAAQEAGRDRHSHDVVSATADELNIGGSVASVTAGQNSGGIGFLGIAAGGSGNSASASTFGFNVGSRDLSADSRQQVRETTHQQASNVRSSRAALVEEVSVSETEQFQTRVVANYNHQHALNILYFEVLQVFELSTRVVDARRCLFLPMDTLSFDEAAVRAFARPLTAAAESMGAMGLASRLHRLDADMQARDAHRRRLEADRTRLSTERAKLIEEVRRPAMATGEDTGAEPGDAAPLAVQIESLSRDLAKIESELTWQRDAQSHVDADVIAQLNERGLAFNQALWMQMNPIQVAALLRGREHNGEPLASTIDPTPIGVSGNYLAFRWPFAPGREADAEAFRRRHVDVEGDPGVEDTIVLPTGAVFAEAVPGVANSAERLDLTRFWKWDEGTIPILPTAIASMHQVAHQRPAEARPAPIGPSALRLQPMPAGPAGPAHLLAGALTASLFRDMSGKDVIQPMVEAAQAAAAAGDQSMQKQAHDNIAAFLDHVEKVAPKVLSALRRQQKAGSGTGPGTGAQNGGGTRPGAGTSAGEAPANGLGPSELGGLQNAIGAEGAGLDVEALAGEAAEMGLFLL